MIIHVAASCEKAMKQVTEEEFLVSEMRVSKSAKLEAGQSGRTRENFQMERAVLNLF